MNAAVDDSAFDRLSAEQQPAAAKPATPSAPVNQPPQNDIDPAYLQHRDALEGRAAFQQLAAEQAPTAGAEPHKLNATEQSIVDQTLGHTEESSTLGKIGHAAGAVVKDVGIGLTEIPRQAFLEGPRNAFQSMLSGAQDLGDWLQNTAHIPGLKVDEHGVHVVSSEELQQLRDEPGDHSLMDFHKAPLRDFGKATTVTGGVAENVSQFITSMATLGRAFGPMGTDAGGVMGHIAQAGKSVAAMFAGFDKASGNLADLVEKVPALSNPVTRFLSSDPDDNEAEGRLKNAITGMGFGELQNGLLAGIKFLRGALSAKAAIPELPTTPGPEPAGTVQTPAAFQFLGNADAAPEEPLATIKPPDLEADKALRAQAATEGLTPEQVQAMGAPTSAEELAGPKVPGATEAQAKEPQVHINFARIDTPDDVKRTLSQLADAQSENIDVAKRGIRDFETTKLGANFQDAWKTLMERRSGEPLNAEQQLAGRQLLAQSAMKAEQLTQMTVENPTPENLFAWRKQMQTHAMIQAEVSGSQAEIARSLGAMRIPVSGQGAIDRIGAITSQLDKMGGLKTNMDFLQATKTLIDSGKLEDLGNVAEKSAYATTRDGLITAWTNGLLTNPLTHVKVNLSNIGTIALRLGETRFAEAMDQVTDYDGVPAGEAAQTTAGLISGIKDSFRYLAKLSGLPAQAPESSPIQDAAQAFKTGHYSVGEQPTDWMQPGQEAANALSVADDGGWVGKATDIMSSIVTSPGRALAGEHEFYRSIGMRMELNRFAYRQALSELNAGKIEAGDLAGRVAELVENPPPNMTTKAVDGMTYQTFTDAPGKLAEIIGNLREAFPSVRVILPFYKIPSRIMSFTFERSPLAPLMAGWRADIAAGGARQSMALAKTAIGSAVMLAASDAVLNGSITGQGPKDKAQRQALMDSGWLPYSVKLPSGRYVQYNRLETVGSSMAMAADMTETMRDYFTAVNKDDPHAEQLTAAGIATLANNVTSKTYFEGLARFFDAISDPRANAESMLKSLAGSVVPAGVGAVAGLMDPYTHATYSMMDAIRARTPGVSKDLPPLTNTWGEPVRHDSGLGKAYDAFVPFASRRPSDEPIDQEILKQGMHVTSPPAKTSINGALVDLAKDPELYHRYSQLAGNELKDPAWGLGAKDLLNSIVSGNHPLSAIYNMKTDGPDGGKALMLRGLIEQFRRDAGTTLLNEQTPQSLALKEKVTATKQRQAALKMPVIAQGTP
jgi:hypothetical protein